MALGNVRPSLGAAGIAGIVLGALLLGAGSLSYPWTQRDGASAAYIGATIVDGGAPYRDAWNVKGPGIDFAYALSILVFGQRATGARVFELLWQTATALVVAFLGVRMFGSRAAGMVAAIGYLLAYFSQPFQSWTEPDGMLSLPLALGLLFLLWALKTDRWVLWALAGAVTALAALFKLPLGLVGIAFLVFAVRREGRTTDRVLFRPLALALGFAVPFAGLAGYLSSKGALDDFVTAQFVFAPEYVARLRHVTSWSCLGHSVTHPILAFFYLLAAVGLYALARGAARGERVAAPAAVLCAWLGVAILTIAMHGIWLRYHYLPMAAPLALLAAGPVVGLWQKARGSGALLARGVLALVALSLVLPLLVVGGHYRHAWRVWSNREEPNRWQVLGAYLRERTDPRDTIFVWGNVPVIYLYSERKAASRFLSSYFLSVPWQHVDYRPVFLAEIRSREPVYFVLVEERPYPPCLDQEEGGSLGAFERWTALKRIVEQDYSLETTGSDYRVYRRRVPGGDAGSNATVRTPG